MHFRMIDYLCDYLENLLSQIGCSIDLGICLQQFPTVRFTWKLSRTQVQSLKKYKPWLITKLGCTKMKINRKRILIVFPEVFDVAFLMPEMHDFVTNMLRPLTMAIGVNFVDNSPRLFMLRLSSQVIAHVLVEEQCNRGLSMMQAMICSLEQHQCNDPHTLRIIADQELTVSERFAFSPPSGSTVSWLSGEHLRRKSQPWSHTIVAFLIHEENCCESELSSLITDGHLYGIHVVLLCSDECPSAITSQFKVTLEPRDAIRYTCRSPNESISFIPVLPEFPDESYSEVAKATLLLLPETKAASMFDIQYSDPMLSENHTLDPFSDVYTDLDALVSPGDTFWETLF